jgi:hypothetical protein
MDKGTLQGKQTVPRNQTHLGDDDVGVNAVRTLLTVLFFCGFVAVGTNDAISSVVFIPHPSAGIAGVEGKAGQLNVSTGLGLANIVCLRHATIAVASWVNGAWTIVPA